MIISHLPQDLVEEILSRVPATSLKRLRSTCKRWNALFKDMGFTEKHFRNAAKQSLVLSLKQSSVFLSSISLSAAAPSTEIKVPLSLKDPHSSSKKVGIVDIFHCDGLLLCTTTMDDRIVVWNPCSGETRWIQTKPYSEELTWFALGHDNNNNNNFCHSYKILRCYQANDLKSRVFEIYELKSSSGSWRVLDDVSVDYFIGSTAVSLEGNAYWLSLDRRDMCEVTEVLTSFDFGRERFRRLCLPTFQSHRYQMFMLSARQEQLSVLHKDYSTSKMEIWVTNKIDTEAALWTKSFTVDFDDNGFDKFPSFFLMDEEKKVVVCCNASHEANLGRMVYTIDKYSTESSIVVATKLSGCPNFYNYVPSLVQIPAKSKERNLAMEITK